MSKEISKVQYEDVRKQIGHYKKMDYHPEIRPAGKVVLANGLEDCFKDYKLEDCVEALKSTLNIRDNNRGNEFSNFSSKIGTTQSGLYTGVKSCLEPSKRTQFQSLIDELRNTVMNSYWKKEIGKIPDQTPNLPDGMDTVLTTFGKSTKSGILTAAMIFLNYRHRGKHGSHWSGKTGKSGNSENGQEKVKELYGDTKQDRIKDETAAELVSPSKTASKVIAESEIGHALYRKSHNDYNPSEQVNREYAEPFDKKHKYGREIKIDKLGGKVKRSMRWFNQDVASIVNNLQADFLQDTQPRLGRNVVRADIAPLLDGRTFGKTSERGSFGVGELLRDSLPDIDKPVQRRYLEHINMLRLYLKKRALSFTDLYQTFVYYDRNKTETMTMDDTYRILKTFQIYPEKQLFETLLNALNLIRDGKVSYKDVTDLLSWKCEFPPLPKIDDVPLEHRHYSSTYKDTICNAHFQETKPHYPAGLGTERLDVPYAVVPPGGPRCERESLGDQTSIAAILSPNIFTQNGLSHMDFFKTRRLHEIRSLFEDIGIDFPGESFSVLWNEGLKKDCTGGVCIETFRGLLDQLAAATYEEIPVS